MGLWASNTQSIPTLLTDLITQLEDCPYTTADVRGVIENCIRGYITHGAYAAWSAMASGTRPWAPLAVLPPDVRVLRRAAWAAAQRIQVGLIERGAVNPAVEERWSAVFGKLPAIQRQFDIHKA